MKEAQIEPKIIGQVFLIPTRLIRPMKGQPREGFDEESIKEFAERLREQGQRQPAIVKKLDAADEKGCLYELVSGERRWRACTLIGQDLKAIISETATSIEQYIEAVVANCQSENLTTLEYIHSVAFLHNSGKSDQEIAKIFGKKSALWAYQHRRAVSLHPGVLKLLGHETPEEKRIALNSALLLVDIPMNEQMGFAEMISEQGLPARQVDHLVKNRLAQCGIPRKNRSSDEFKSLLSFFKRTNLEIELLVDHDDTRVANLLKGRTPDEIRELVNAVSDCLDNLEVAQKAIDEETAKQK